MTGLMNMTSNLVQVNPTAIRFTQNPNAVSYTQNPNAVKFTTRSGEKVPLEETLNRLRSGELSHDDFLPLKVSRDIDGLLWSKDDTTLWVFREAGISEITVEIVFREIKVSPNALRFTQDSIAPCLTHEGKDVPLEEVLTKLNYGILKPSVFPPLDVFEDPNGVLWSNDNRRLWLFRKAGIPEITVKLFSKPLFRAPPRSDRDRALMSPLDFFPKVRGQLQQTGLTFTQQVNDELYRAPERSDRNQDSQSKSDFFSMIQGESQETSSTSTQEMGDNSHALLTGAVAAASALVMGFAGWKMYKQTRE